MYVRAFSLSLIAAIVVPSAGPSIVVVSKEQRIDCHLLVVVAATQWADSVELFHDCSLNDDILLILLKLHGVLKVQLIISFIYLGHMMLTHVKTDWKNSRETEVRILYIRSIHLLVFVKQIWVLELLNWLMNDLGNPVVDSKPSILHDHFL